MRNLTILLVSLCSCLLTNGQTDYLCGNQAYQSEKLQGHNPVTINQGNMIYTWDAANHFYISDRYILIPNKDTLPNGKWVDTKIFFGYGIGGLINDTSYNWDTQSILPGNSVADATGIFVSPVSTVTMSYAQALQCNCNICGWASCYAHIAGPVSQLAYPGYSPDTGVFDIWTGEELINLGPIKGTAVDQKVSQQQLSSCPDQSYCVQTCGEGWRLPTDMEAGHTNDMQGFGNGFQDVYKANNAGYMWTSSLFITYTVKRWAVSFTSGYWENCTGFVYVNNSVRCVYDPDPSIITGIPQKTKEEISLYPNPANDLLIISGLSPGAKSNYEIYDISGRLMQQGSLTPTNQTYSLSLSQLPDGMYHLRLVSEKPEVIIRKKFFHIEN